MGECGCYIHDGFAWCLPSEQRQCRVLQPDMLRGVDKRIEGACEEQAGDVEWADGFEDWKTHAGVNNADDHRWHQQEDKMGEENAEREPVGLEMNNKFKQFRIIGTWAIFLLSRFSTRFIRLEIFTVTRSL